MHFEFSDDQVQLRDTVRKWVEKSYGFERRQQIVAAGGFSADAYREMAELGLPALYVAEEDGGMQMGPVDAMVVMEELGAGLVLEPLVHTLIAARLLAAAEDVSLKTRYSSALASGAVRISLAHQERSARYRTSFSDTVAVADGDAWRIRGDKTLVPAGDSVDAYIVPAMVDGQLALFLVDRDEGVSVDQVYPLLDGSRGADVRFDDAPARMLTAGGAAMLDLALDIGIAALCAYGVGIMDRTVGITADYLRTRKQFGVEIASFQALRHKLADMKMELELSRSLSYYASLRLDAPDDDRRRAVSSAKYQLGVSMRKVGQEAVQLHGGIGMTDEYIVSHYFKALTQLEMTFGDSFHHLGEVSARLTERAGVI